MWNERYLIKNFKVFLIIYFIKILSYPVLHNHWNRKHPLIHFCRLLSFSVSSSLFYLNYILLWHKKEMLSSEHSSKSHVKNFYHITLSSQRHILLHQILLYLPNRCHVLSLARTFSKHFPKKGFYLRVTTGEKLFCKR